MLMAFRDVESTPEYLTQIRAEISHLKKRAKAEPCPVGLMFLEEHATVVETEIRDKEQGLARVTFHWTGKHFGHKFDREYLRVPAREITRLKLKKAIGNLGDISLDKKYYYFALNDRHAFYAARKAEGRPVHRLPELAVHDTEPVDVMADLYSLNKGSLKLVKGKKVYV